MAGGGRRGDADPPHSRLRSGQVRFCAPRRQGAGRRCAGLRHAQPRAGRSLVAQARIERHVPVTVPRARRGGAGRRARRVSARRCAGQCRARARRAAPRGCGRRAIDNPVGTRCRGQHLGLLRRLRSSSTSRRNTTTTTWPTSALRPPAPSRCYPSASGVARSYGPSHPMPRARPWLWTMSASWRCCRARSASAWGDSCASAVASAIRCR